MTSSPSPRSTPAPPTALRTASPTIARPLATPPESAAPVTTTADVRAATGTPRPRGRVTALLTALALACGAASFALPQTASADPRVPATGAEAPGLEALNHALSSAESFIRPLYHQVTPYRAVNAEYYGLPLRVRLAEEGPGGAWHMVGAADGVLTVEPSTAGFFDEHYDVTIAGAEKTRLTVELSWDRATGDETVRLTRPATTGAGTESAAAAGVAAPRRLSFAVGDHVLGELGTTPGAALTTVVPRGDRESLRSLRYTVRHSTQQAYGFYTTLGERGRADALATHMRGSGFTPGLDLFAPLWGLTQTRPEDYDDAAAIYHDCDVTIPADETAYAYDSKVCRTDPEAYQRLTAVDSLVPALQAVAVVRRDGADATYRRSGTDLPPVPGMDAQAGATRDATPRATVAWLEKLQRDTAGGGIPRCLPGYCESGVGSAVRTAAFGTLEALLGYRYGDETSRTYADAAAATMLAHQIPDDGLVRTTDGQVLRPSAAGAFMAMWDREGRAYFRPTMFATVSEKVGTSPEFAGVVPSNGETSLSSYAFLTAYRCLKYAVGCVPTAATGPGHPTKG